MASPLTGAPGGAILYVLIGLLVWPRGAGPAAAGSAASEGPLGGWGGRIMWAVVWIGTGMLWLLPANRAGGSVSSAISGATTGEPGWLSHVPLSIAHAIGSGGDSVAIGFAVQSFVVGLGPLLSRHTSVFLVIGAALALDYWILGEAFGSVFAGLATDPNTGPLFVLLALAVYPNRVRMSSMAALSRRAGDYLTPFETMASQEAQRLGGRSRWPAVAPLDELGRQQEGDRPDALSQAVLGHAVRVASQGRHS